MDGDPHRDPAVADLALDRSTIAALMLRLALVIGVTEALLMGFSIAFGWYRYGAWLVIADPLLLMALSAPVLLRLVVRPFVAERERMLDAARFLAYHDWLTRLPNRRLFNEHLERRLAEQARGGRFGALLYFDLDGFKPINDEHGHQVGDAVLAEIGRRLACSVRAGEVVARVGGDEFAVLVGDAGESRESARRATEELAMRVGALVREPIDVDEVRLQVGCTIGIHLLAPGADNPRQAVSAGDAAMYHAKRGLPGSIVFSDQAHDQRYGIIPIGVDAIDREHREIDRLLEAALQGDGTGDPGAIVTAVERHFQSEVRTSRELRLNMTPEHELEHQRLIDWMHRLQPASNGATVARSTLHEIAEAMRNHVVDYDRALRERPFAPSRAGATSAAGEPTESR